MKDFFRIFAALVSRMIGSVWAFFIFIAVLLISGYWFEFSYQWESNVGFLIAVLTLSILFFLQKSQNHSDKATHLKLDELIRAVEGARNEIVSVENQAEDLLESLRED